MTETEMDGSNKELTSNDSPSTTATTVVEVNFPDVVNGINKFLINLMGQQWKGSGVNSLRELGWETGSLEQQVRNRFHQFGQRMSTIQLPPVVNAYLDSAKTYGSEHPLTTLTILALVVSCAIPVVVFLSFAFITLLVTFIGFLFVEGTILGVASVVLGGALLIIGFITLTFVSFALVGYFVTAKVYTLITGDAQPHRFLAKLPIIGYLFANTEHAATNGDALKIPNGYEEEDAASDDSLAHTD